MFQRQLFHLEQENYQDNRSSSFSFVMNIDHWLLPLPLNDRQETDLRRCQDKLTSLLDLPLRVQCVSSESPWTNPPEQTTLTLNNRNPLKMYWQRNLNELRLFLKPSLENAGKLDANIIEIHKRRRLQLTRFIKQEILHSSVLLSFSPGTTNDDHLLLLTITGKHCILEFQIPALDRALVCHGTYRKMDEDAQSRPATALFHCTIEIDPEMASLLSQYGLCRLWS